MDFRVPAYLLAIAVGELEYHAYTERCGVWAEPYLIEEATTEFASMSQIIEVAEEMFGEYPFGTYCVLVLPAAFPYGGMENPCLTFLTPIIVCGDGSSVRLVCHELMHSWYGNSNTNKTWRDFWLNEGWTTWAELRMLEELKGVGTAQLRRMVQHRAFVRDNDRWNKRGRPYMSALAPDVANTDPDETFSFRWSLDPGGPFQDFQDFVQVVCVRTVMAFFIVQSQRFSRFLEEVRQFLHLQ